MLRHMSLADYVAYLRDYAVHFGILERIRFNVKALLFLLARVSIQVPGVFGFWRIFKAFRV